MTRVLGLSAFGRSAASCAIDGCVQATAAEEFFSRRKKDPTPPAQAFEWCLEQSGLSRADLDYVVFAEKPVQKFIRILAGIAQGFPGTMRVFPDTMFTWLGDRLWLKSGLVKGLGVDGQKLLFVERNVAQVMSAFHSAGADNAAVLIVDGSSEWATTTLAHAQRDDGRVQIELLAEIQHPHSLVFLLEAVARHAMVPDGGGLAWLSALAAYGEPSYRKVFEEIVKAEEDGAFSLALRKFRFVGGTPRFHTRAYADLGMPRGDGQPLRFDEPRDPDVQRFADIARSAQEVCIDRCVALLERAKQQSDAETICLGGSLFSDPRIVEAVLDRSPFAETHVDAHSDDVAAAIGAALYVDHVVESSAVDASDVVPVSAASAEKLETLKARPGLTIEDCEEAALAGRVASALAEGLVIGLVTGDAETTATPRGSRVFLVDGANAEAVNRLRNRIKLAEGHVPLAMLIHEDQKAAWNGSQVQLEQLAGTIEVPSALRAACPGGVHVDGRSVVHVAAESSQPRLAAILHDFAGKKGGSPVLAQTSLNRSGDPLVFRASDALDLLLRSEMDFLVWGTQIARRS